MPKTDIFKENADISNELAYIKTQANLLNKITSYNDCNTFIANPDLYADPWQIVFLAYRDTIFTQGNEYGTNTAEIENIIETINNVNSDLQEYKTNHNGLYNALATLVGLKAVDPLFWNDGDSTGGSTSIVDATYNAAKIINSYGSKLEELENSFDAKNYSLTYDSAYLTLAVSNDGLSYTLGTKDIMSAAQIASEIERLDGAIEDEKTRAEGVESDLASYLVNLVTTKEGQEPQTHSTVADYVTTYVSYAIEAVNTNTAALEGRVSTIASDMVSYHNDIEYLKTAYVVTAYQNQGGTIVPVGPTVNLNDGPLILKQNGKDIVTLNVPIDMVLKEGTLITATADDVAINPSVIAGEKYIKLVLNDNNNQGGTSNPIYIAVKDLVDLYDVEGNNGINLSTDTRTVNGERITYITGSINTEWLNDQINSYVTQDLNAISGVNLTAGDTEGYVTLSYAYLNGTSGSVDVNLSSKFATHEQFEELSDEALKEIIINGQTLTSASYSYTLDGNNINVTYNTKSTALTGTINDAIHKIEEDIQAAQNGGVLSVEAGEGVVVNGTGDGNKKTGHIIVSAYGSTVKSDSLTGTYNYITQNSTIDANLSALDTQAKINADEILAIKEALKWTIIGS